MSTTTTTLERLLERVVYQSEADGFTAARLQVPGRRDPGTIIGNILPVNPGETLRLTGRWVLNTKLGAQFQVKR